MPRPRFCIVRQTGPLARSRNNSTHKAPTRPSDPPPLVKQLKRWGDWIVTMGKQRTITARRRAQAILRTDESLLKVFSTMADRYMDRQGGYTRVLRSVFNTRITRPDDLQKASCFLSPLLSSPLLSSPLLSSPLLSSPPLSSPLLPSPPPPCPCPRPLSPPPLILPQSTHIKSTSAPASLPCPP
jgi:hypothetical protein